MIPAGHLKVRLDIVLYGFQSLNRHVLQLLGIRHTILAAEHGSHGARQLGKALWLHRFLLRPHIKCGRAAAAAASRRICRLLRMGILSPDNRNFPSGKLIFCPGSEQLFRSDIHLYQR